MHFEKLFIFCFIIIWLNVCFINLSTSMKSYEIRKSGMFKEQLQTKVTWFWFLKLCFSKLCIEVKPLLSRKIFPAGISSVQHIYFREPSTWNTNNNITCNHNSRNLRITFDRGVFFWGSSRWLIRSLLQPLGLRAGVIRGVDIRGG